MVRGNEYSSLLRFGHVKEYSPALHAAKVFFPDTGLTSAFLPVLVHNSLRNHDETHLDEGEHVACLMAGNGAETGIILGAFYDDKNTPPVADKDIRAVTFSDGTQITYDRDGKRLVVSCAGDIEIEAKGSITMKASRIDLN